MKDKTLMLNACFKVFFFFCIKRNEKQLKGKLVTYEPL